MEQTLTLHTITRAQNIARKADALLSRGPFHYMLSEKKPRDDKERAFELYVQAGEVALAAAPGAALLYFRRAAEIAEEFHVDKNSTLFKLYSKIAEMSKEIGEDFAADVKKAEQIALQKPDYSNAAKICEFIGTDESLARATNYYTIGGHTLAANRCMRARANMAVDNNDYSKAAGLFADAAATPSALYGYSCIAEQVLCHLALGDIVAARKFPGYAKTVEAFEGGDFEEFRAVFGRQSTTSIRDKEVVGKLMDVIEMKMMDDSDDML